MGLGGWCIAIRRLAREGDVRIAQTLMALSERFSPFMRSEISVATSLPPLRRRHCQAHSLFVRNTQTEGTLHQSTFREVKSTLFLRRFQATDATNNDSVKPKGEESGDNLLSGGRGHLECTDLGGADCGERFSFSLGGATFEIAFQAPHFLATLPALHSKRDHLLQRETNRTHAQPSPNRLQCDFGWRHGLFLLRLFQATCRPGAPQQASGHNVR